MLFSELPLSERSAGVNEPALSVDADQQDVLPAVSSTISDTINRLVGRTDPNTGEKPLFKVFEDVLPAAKGIVSYGSVMLACD